MKITVSMKDPDTLDDAIKDAVAAEIKAVDLPDDEKDLLIKSRVEKAREVCRKWFEYGEYLVVEVDTDAKTCVVKPVR